MSALLKGVILAALAGICSNQWTVLLKLSGLNGFYMPLGYATGSIAVSVPLAIWAHYVLGVSFEGVRVGILAGAIAMSGGMLLLIVAMLAITPKSQIGVPLMIWALSQVSMAALYTWYMGGMTLRLALGSVTAMLSVYLLLSAR